MSQFSLIQKRAIISVAAAFAVHGLVFGSWILLILWDLPIFAYQETPYEERPEPEVTVVLKPFVEPEPVELPEPEPLPQPKQLPPLPEIPKIPKPEIAEEQPPQQEKALPEQKRKYARTSEDQAGTPDQPTDLIGDRDTLAASDLAPTLGADPNTPSQDGENPLFPGQVETVTREYEDGSVGMDKTGEETETPQEETASRKDTPDVDIAPKVETPEPEQEDSARPKNKHLDKGEMLPNTDAGEGKGLVQDRPKADESPKERPNEGENKESQGEEIDQKPKKDGFSGHSRKNRVTGSINRRGKSSLNVKNTALGRYQAQVSKAVELQWRRNCEQHRDHIVPGVISLRFYVDEKGKVSGVKFQEVIAANFIERGFTQRAIRQAKLPKMPSAVVKELDGEPLELIYNFYF
ncbi:hypothetical protein HW115_01640 [Verrucomicrobiaceae bacterium N1E253]|uniref:TonB C-terminal domain-containing protein n=1 Tax=Oceaniferula marina TaxID=2748318 RepID=A0A851GA56_9BACT|nr:hypothetical protein [Oceaniferula marina]NWK54296.1 hypothetical protein [Oceaniferula marina]